MWKFGHLVLNLIHRTIDFRALTVDIFMVRDKTFLVLNTARKWIWNASARGVARERTTRGLDRRELDFDELLVWNFPWLGRPRSKETRVDRETNV